MKEKLTLIRAKVLRREVSSEEAELQKNCGHAGITGEEGLLYVRSVRKIW